jgi:hypothetical protein
MDKTLNFIIEKSLLAFARICFGVIWVADEVNAWRKRG